MSVLQKLFDTISAFFRKYRKKYPDADYRDIWGAIICALGSNAMLEFSDWSREIKLGGMTYSTFTEKVLDLPEKTVNGRGEENLVEQNHFMIQIFRIPLEKTPTIGHLMQIACYLGLVEARFKVREFPGNLGQLFKSYGVSLINYINEEDITLIESQLGNDVIKIASSTCKDLLKLARQRSIFGGESSSSDTETD